MADRRRAPAMRGSRILWLALLCLGSTMYMPARCQQHAAAQKTLPELPQVGNLPHLPALNVNSFAGSAVQPVLEALPNVAPTPSVQQVGYEAAHAAVLQANAASQAAKSAVAPSVAEVHAVEGPVQALAHAVSAVGSDFASDYGLGPSAQPPVPGPRPAMLRNIVITGEGDTTAEAEAAAPSQQGPPELPMLPQPAPLPQAPQPAVHAPAPAPGVASLTSRSTDALHSAGVSSFQAVQQPQQPAEPKTELISNNDGTQTVIVKMPRIEDPATSLQSQLPQLPNAGQNRRRLDELSAPAPAPVAMGPTRGLPSLPAVPSLGLPDMPQIALPATAEGLVTPLPAPKPQGPSAAVAYEAAQPYSAFYKLLPVLSGTGVGRKLSQQPGPQQPGPQQQQQPQQQGPQQPAGGQTQPQSFQQHSGQTPADQRQAAAVQSSAITIHPDITLDQDTKILTVGQGQASFFGQKYTLPALPFKLPATPALNSLQTIYPNMNLGDAPLNNAPAGAPGYAPAPQAEIAAAIAAEEAPTPEEKAVSNPVTNVLSALLAGRRLLQNQPGPQQPQQQQPGPQQQAPQQPAGGQTQPQSFQQHSGQTPADQRQAAAVQSSAITIHPDITLDQDTKILTVGQGQASFFGQKYTLPALPFKLPATPALNSLQTIYPNMNLGDAPLINAPAGAPGYAPAPQAEIAAAIAAEEAPTPEEKAVSNPVTNVLSALLAGRRLLQNQPGPQQPQQQQPGPQQQAPQQPAGGQTQPQSFQQHSGQTPADQRQAAAVQSSAITIHPDITLDQDTKILTVGQGQASFFGQKYTLPALPFKLPATPALNSLQTIYPNMNLGDAPLVNAPAGAPGYAPAPQAEIAAAIAAEEAPTPEEKAVSNPVTNVLSALLAGRRLQQTDFEQLDKAPLSVKDAAVVANSAIYQSLQEAQQIFNPPAVAPAAFAPSPSQVGGERGLPALPKVPTLGLAGMPAIALPSNPSELWAPLPAPNQNNIFATRTAEAVKPYTAFYDALPHVSASAITGRKLTQLPPANDPSKPAQPFGYRNPKPLFQVEPKVLVDQKNKKAFATGGDVVLANGEKIPLPGGFALPTSGIWSGLLDIPQGAIVEGPVPAPDLAPAVPAHQAPAMAPAPSAAPNNPLSFLVNALTTIGDAAQAQANSAPATTGRRLAQLPPANDPSKPAQPFGYRNPKPLIQVEPKMLIDQKNKKAFATGGDILLANGEKIPLPGGFALPTTGLWSNLLDIPVGTQVEGPIPAPDLAPVAPAAQHAPAMAPAPSAMAAANAVNPLSFLVKGITSIGDALEAQANTKAGTRRRLLQREEAVQGLTLSVALLGETKGTFAPKQEAFVKELEQGLGLQAGAVKVTKLQMQKARYAEDVLRLGRHLMANAQTKGQTDLVVTFTLETATPEETLAALKGMVGSSGQVTSALQSQARVHLVADSLREIPPASDA